MRFAFRPALALLVALTLVTGVLYPLVVTGIGMVLFPRPSRGSLIVEHGVVRGSSQIGQPFDAPGDFWGRPSATSRVPYDAALSTGSNLGPLNPALIDAVRARVAALRAADPTNPAPVPVDLVTASGSGLDPHISPAAAEYQVPRVARARGLDEGMVRALVAQAHDAAATRRAGRAGGERPANSTWHSMGRSNVRVGECRPFVICLVVSAMVAGAASASATPSSTDWTPATTDVQAFRVLHVGIDNYFTTFRTARDGAGDFPTDVGLTVGVLPVRKVQMEIGIDTLEPSDHPLYFNAKLGTPENILFRGAPALSVGVFNVGTESGATDQNIVHGVLGKTIPGVCRLFVGGYVGNDRVLVDARGEAAGSGFMLGFDRGFLPVGAAGGDSFNRLVLAGDFASGKNAFGGGGLGLYYYFSPSISLLTGPVWFNEEAINGEWKWTTQLDVNAPF